MKEESTSKDTLERWGWSLCGGDIQADFRCEKGQSRHSEGILKVKNNISHVTDLIKCALDEKRIYRGENVRSFMSYTS